MDEDFLCSYIFDLNTASRRTIRSKTLTYHVLLDYRGKIQVEYFPRQKEDLNRSLFRKKIDR